MNALDARDCNATSGTATGYNFAYLDEQTKRSIRRPACAR